MLGAVLVLLVSAVGVLAWWLPGYVHRRAEAALEQKLSARLDAEVDVGELELSWGHVTIRDLTVRRAGVQLIRIEVIDVPVSEDALWSGYVVATDATLRGGEITGTRQQLQELAAKVLRGKDEPEQAPGRVRPIPPQIRIEDLHVAVTDGDRAIDADIDLTVRPRERQFDVVLSDLVVELGEKRKIVASRLATGFALGPQRQVPMPLSVEVAGLGTRVTPRIAVAGVTGAVTIHDPKLTEVSVDLRGGFSDRAEAADADALWSVAGRVRRDLSAGRLSLSMRSFELGRVPSVLKHLPLVDSEEATVGGRVAVELGAGVVHIDGDVTLDGLNVQHPTLARTTVRDVGFSARLVAEVEPQARRVRIPTAYLERDGVRMELSAMLDHAEDRDARHYQAEIRMPTRPCQDVLRALPPDLVPALQGFELEGDFDMWAKVDADFADLDALVLDGDVAAWNCKVTRPPPSANAANLVGSFTHRVTMRDGRTRTVQLYTGSSTFTPLEEISPYMVGAVLTTEDGGFYRHKGFLPSQFQTALQRNLAAGKVRLGASTISMQMIKNVWLSHERTLSRKAQEMFLTWYVETQVSKRRILEIYLNIVELGPGIYGVTRAAEHYFGKSPGELTPVEAMYLAMMLPSPVRRHVHYCNGAPSEKFLAKVHRLLGIMAGRGRIDALDYEVYKNEPVVFDLRERGDSGACLAEIDHLMAAQEGQRALTGLLPPPSDFEIVVEDDEPPPLAVDDDDEGPRRPGEGGYDPANADAPGRPAMDDVPPDDDELDDLPPPPSRDGGDGP